MRLDENQGMFLFMPAFMKPGNVFGTKIVSVFPNNLQRGLSTIQGIYMLNDPATGELLALMDGIFLTSLRTGATSAVATKYLARKDAAILGIVGSGGQAAFQAAAICKVRPIREISVFDTNSRSAREFSETASRDLKLPVTAVNSVHEVVISADILVTTTTAKEPVFDGNDLKPGTHINAVGYQGPACRELDTITIKKARIIVDTYEGCMAEAGDLLVPIQQGELSKEDIYADLGEIVSGQKKGRINDAEITLFESVGFALEDLVTAMAAYQKAGQRGIGVEFNFD
jgi:ornithine cyclodeaminase/alanine dehydrogenase-like protein (mu-crystallin family)